MAGGLTAANPRRRSRLLRTCACLLAAALPVSSLGCGDASSRRQVTVFAASSLTVVFAEMSEAFMREHPDVEVVLQFAGSSSLAAQIKAGARVDVFASANERVMADLLGAVGGDTEEGAEGVEAEQEGAGSPPRLRRTITPGEVEAEQEGAGGKEASAAVFARNRLALATPADNPGGVQGLESLSDPDLLVAACAPEVPCGALARKVLANYDSIVDTYEPSVRSVLGKLLLGEVDAGLVYVTDLAADGILRFDLPSSPTASYHLVVLGDGRAAQAFADFVLSPPARSILARAGFLLP